MKRISLLVALLALTPGTVQAYYYSYNCGVRHSPYAFSYHNSGLVRGDAEYTPYALHYYGSGMVAGYGVCPTAYPALIFPLGRVSLAAHRVPSVAQASAPAATGPLLARDAMNTIRQHLQAKGLGDVNIDRILRVDNQLVSVDVHVKNRNLLIKYWNPQEVRRLNANESSKGIAYTRYKESWERYAQQYRHTGGEIYTINAAEPQAIVAALDSCPRLGPGGATQTVLYAKN